MQHESAPLRIAVQDRQRLFRDGLALVLHAEPDFHVVATASTATELVSALGDEKVDIVILELDAPDWDACRLVAALRRQNSDLAVLGTWDSEEKTPSMRAYQAGVRTVFPRSAGIRTLLQTIRAVPLRANAPAPRTVVRLEERRPLLTEREVQVLDNIGSGRTTRGVAASMGISPKTVENHKQRIFSKLGVQNQAHAVSIALRQGLISPAAALSSSGSAGFSHAGSAGRSF